MLLHLSIRQFALVEQLDLEFRHGMAVITGETGAGKSILLDALGLALGNRAEAGAVRQGADKSEISATFTPSSRAVDWLHDRDYPDEDVIVLRRVVTAEGRSRGYINGRPCSASDLKSLSACLIEVHSQHAHHRLLEKDAPRATLDAYGGYDSHLDAVSQRWKAWQTARKRLQRLSEESGELRAQRQLLNYQVEELRQLNLGEQELEQLELEHKRLANAESMLLSGQQAMAACCGDEQNDQGAVQMAWHTLQQLASIDDQDTSLNEARELMQQAYILLDEAGRSLHQYLEQIDINPHRLQQLDQRLSDIFTMARKHQIDPRRLYQHWQKQEQALSELCLSDEDLEQLQQEVIELEQDFVDASQQLAHKRSLAAAQMDQQMRTHFETMGLGKVQFITELQSLPLHQANQYGMDNVQFMVQTNPGMPAGPLGKVASGGELSRISLAIQVVTAATTEVDSMIFDEVDVGIGGGTAERVGRLMRTLGEQSQVMCVTHQPQVAAQAHQHFQVSKISGDQQTHTRIRELSDTQRTEELARMLGGVDITHQTLAHAKEMLVMAR